MQAQTQKLAINRLSKRFGDLAVLQDIDAVVDRGEFIALVGPSGCGKTTLLRIVAGLEASSAGEVLLDGRRVRAPGPDRGFVFQSDNLLPWRTVLANAIIGPEFAGEPARRSDDARSNCCGSSASKGSRTIIRASFPAACASASISPARSRSIPKSC